MPYAAAHERVHVLDVLSHMHAPPGQAVCVVYEPQAATQPAVGWSAAFHTQFLLPLHELASAYLYWHLVMHWPLTQLQLGDEPVCC